MQLQLTRHDTDRGRFYETADGLLLPSVTSIIKATRSEEERDRLRNWQRKVDRLRQNGKTVETAEESRQRGTSFHEEVERLMTSGEEPDEPSVFYQVARSQLLAFKQGAIAVETSVYHAELQYAGTFDLLSYYLCQNTIVDFKSSKRQKQRAWMEEAFLQTAAYAIAAEALGLADQIVQIAILVAHPQGVQLFIEDTINWSAAWKERLKKFEKL